MLWTWPTGGAGSMWREMDRLQRDMNRLFEPFSRGVNRGDGYPAVNVWTGEDEVLVTAELPGIDPAGIDVTVKEGVLTIRGSREPEELRDGETYLRRERGAGTFVRSLTLPFRVDSAKVSATYANGILRLALPRREDDKPKKIAVRAG